MKALRAGERRGYGMVKSLRLAPCGTLLLCGVAHASVPLGFLRGDGPKAYPVIAFTLGVLGIAIAVVVIISVLVIAGVLVRAGTGADAAALPAIKRGGNGLPWLYWGVGLSSITLLGTLVWTLVVLADVSSPPVSSSGHEPHTIEVTGQQWWWKARYLTSDPSHIFTTTAGEIHIPVGVPVRVYLMSTDVIHSFWVPALTGTTEAIPGLHNKTWLEASRPGRYYGQCTLYCGKQHAHVAFVVVAQKRAAFMAWWNAQLQPAPAPLQIAAGEHAFVYHCGICHMVRGSGAAGQPGPDLTHLMSRSILAGGILTNKVANLSGWIANPQEIKPGTHMPDLYLLSVRVAAPKHSHLPRNPEVR